jgi:PAS domain S-box-containing protein
MPLSGQKLFGKSVALARQKAGLTQKELADKSGVSIRHIQEIEHGRADIKLSVLKKIASAVNTSAVELIQESLPASGSVFDDALCPRRIAGVHCPVDNIRSAIILVDTKGIVWFLSSRAEIALGYTREEACGLMRIWDFIDEEEERESLLHYISCLIDHGNKPMPFVTTVRSKDGSTTPVTMEWSYLRDRGHGLAGFVVTLTDR